MNLKNLKLGKEMDIFDKIDRALIKFNEHTPLPKIITGDVFTINKREIWKKTIIEINEKRYCERRNLNKKDCLFFFILSLPFSVIMLFLNIFGTNTNFFWKIFPFIIPVVAVLYPLLMPYREMIIDRENGTIGVYKKNRKPVLIIPFERGFGFIRASGMEMVHFSLRFAFKGHPLKGVELEHFDLDKFWSFVVWYIDKNRPLPPGTAFDPYREADFQRRKAEGFPKPLYPSDIATPETTPEQQTERKLIGKW